MTNWPAYDASLRQCGSLTVWFTDAAIAAWAAGPRTTCGGQPWYSPLAILTALTLRAVFRTQRHPDAAVVVPPHATAVPSEAVESAPTQQAATSSTLPGTRA